MSNLPVPIASNVKTWLESNKSAIGNCVPKHLDMNRMFRTAISCINGNYSLQKCSAASLCQSVVQATVLGLEIGGALGEAYVVPFGNKAMMMIGYRGFITLARRTEKIKSIYTDIVRSNDKFSIKRGSNPELIHEIDHTKQGGVVGFYAVFKTTDNETDFEYMTVSEVDAIRARSKAGQSGPWVTDYEEMGRKCPLRRLAKRMPMSYDMSRAVEIDNRATMGETIDDAVDIEGVVLPEDGELEKQQQAEQVKSKMAGLKKKHAPPPTSTATREPTNEEMADWGKEETATPFNS
jgi:recombination protein RecT